MTDLEPPAGAHRTLQDRGSEQSDNTDLVRLSVSLAPDVADALKRLAKNKGVTVTEMIRRAISTATFIDEQVTAGKRILVADKDEKNVREVLFR